ncbi:MAG: 4-(cytidine 5'-diphospho)-2-C-methyl-D-erythritol kinase [Treponema sp.]
MIHDAVSLCAYAKINLHLRILGRRSDNFHEIESIFQRISISDYISVERIKTAGSCIVESPFMALPDKNTITTAWEAFKTVFPVDDGICVRIVKNIPAGSGLGAGSSDAACVLQAVNTLFSAGLTHTGLKDLALTVGSDVPFFLTESPCIVEGRGERFVPLTHRSDCFGLLICTGVCSSTAEAYRQIDALGNTAVHQRKWGRGQLESCYYSPIAEWQFCNDFQPIVEAKYPVVSDAVHDLYGQGAAFVRMSGSGSAVFGLFTDRKIIETAFAVLSKKWNWCKPFILLA